jgi:hypothetical protein
MLDIEIRRFYDSVKATEWPTIDSAADFFNLPAWIQEECYTIYGFQERLNQIVDINHWVNITSDGFVYKDLVFLPIPKCACVYYTTIFTQLGWQKVRLQDIDTKSMKLFGVVIHPFTRFLKGITEWLIRSYSNNLVMSLENPWHIVNLQTNWDKLFSDLDSPPLKNLIKSVNVGDTHSMPYSTMFGDLVNIVHWIPIDAMTDDDVKINMMEFFKLNGHNINLPLNDTRIHQSSPRQHELFDKIKHNITENSTQNFHFYKLFSPDLNLYYNLLKQYSKN